MKKLLSIAASSAQHSATGIAGQAVSIQEKPLKQIAVPPERPQLNADR